MAGIFPKAPDIRTFWNNILNGVNAIGDPLPSWEADRYLDAGRIHTPHGGYLEDLFSFDPREFGIMPNSVDGGEPDQFLALRVSRDALQDAGYLDDRYDHRDTGIVLGHSTYLHRGQVNLIQHNIFLDQTMELLAAVLPSADSEKLLEIRRLLSKKLPQCNADIVPGLVPNVMTGRIANRLNFKGPNYLIDAACASSLLAVNAAIDELRKGRTRMMLAGGVNASLPPEVSMIFTQLGALSRQGKVRPFEKGSDGTLLGEGLGVVVLKRVSDAVADGDRIYAVIREVGNASDGREQGLLAPSVQGEALALERAYLESGIDPLTIGLIEAHGTGIPLGDQTEISALRQIFGERKGPQGSIAVGSVKSMISHCIPAAGIAGLIKGALALHHKVLPPTLCDAVNPDLGIETTPFYVNTATRPWFCQPGTLRRAGINCFGFGGINAHAIIEEAPPRAVRPETLTAWPAELCVFSAKSAEELVLRLDRAAGWIGVNANRSLCDIAAALVKQDTKDLHRLAIVAKDKADLAKKIDTASTRLQKNKGDRWATRSGIVYSSRPLGGKLAFMFPGEGSQYFDMLSDLIMCFDEVRNWFDFWPGLYPDLPGSTRTDIVFPPQNDLSAQRRKELETRLHDMDVGSEAVFIAGQAIFGLLGSFGVTPDVMVGHSSGESSALAASGAIVADDFASLAGFIRELNQVYNRVLSQGKIPTGSLLAVGALPQAVVEEQIAALDKGVVIAMDNCANQLVLFGEKAPIDTLKKSLGDAGGICMPLPFDRGYHTPQFSAVSDAFLDYYETIGVKPPGVPLYSCASAGLFSDDAAEVRRLAASQWARKVRFRETVTNMYRDGVRCFIEVGPSGNLSAFLNDILHGKEALTLATNQRNRNGMEQFLTVLSHLYVNDKAVNLDRLFVSRSVNTAPETAPPNDRTHMHLTNTMPVLHIDDADRAVLNKLLAVPREEAPQADLTDITDFGRQIMTDHFNLMQHFLEQQQTVLGHWRRSQEAAGPPPCPADGHSPFLNVITQRTDQYVEALCRVCVHEDNFLKDHVLSGTVSRENPLLTGLSCVPLMVSLEIMAEACALTAGNRAVKTVENIRALNWIALVDDELTLTVRAQLIDAGLQTYRAEIFNGDSLVVSADFLFDENWFNEGVPELISRQPYRWESHEIYRIGMFHGPIFQSIRQIEGWNETGIDATLSEVRLDGFFCDDETPHLVLNPVLLDAAGQLAACWFAQKAGTDFNCFPSTIERIELYRPCPQNIPGVRLKARQQLLDPLNEGIEAPRLWQFECRDTRGERLFSIKNLENVYFPVPNRFYQFRRDPLNGWLGRPVALTGNRDAFLWQIPHLPETFCSQSGNIFLHILAHALLNFDERQNWRELSTSIRHRREWLLGRACIKEATRFWIFQQTGELLYPSDVTVHHDDKGAPYVDGWWNDTLIPAPEVSLSHDKRLSLAAVSPPRQSVGVDIEHIGKIQETDLLESALTGKEKELLSGFTGNALKEKLLHIWCAKEAAGKYLGLGLQGNPEALEVSFINGNWNLAHVAYSGVVVEVMVSFENESVVALATTHSPEYDEE
jgi:acyl transferase domain-containing protein/phosphopantetheinyl transferase